MSIAYGPKKIIRAAGAGSNQLSDDGANPNAIGRACDLSLYNFASVQLIWSGLTGTLDGVLSIEVSDDGTNWDTKTIQVAGVTVDAKITVSGAAGNDSISIDLLTERYYRARWTKTGVTGGLVTCILIAKGS